MIRIERLEKSFESRLIIDDLSLSLPEKGIVAITGPSGCGKSTLLRIIAGLTSFEKGKVTFDNDEKISLSFQFPNLLPSLTALENVMVTGCEKKDAISLLNELGIFDLDKHPEELSGGMATRVNIARALSKDADIYLFDEPIASLDEETSKKVIEAIIRRTKEKLCIMVLHDKEVANDVSTTLIDIKEAPLSNKTIEITNK